MTLKNVWSLQVGEVIVADLLKKNLGKDYEIFIPLNNQLKDYDLVLMNQKTKKIVTIQVKESREYDLGVANGWFGISKYKVLNLVCDFYVFIVYTADKEGYKMKMRNRVLIVPSQDLLDKSKHKIESRGGFDYYFEIGKNEASENREIKTDYTKYVNNFELLRI